MQSQIETTSALPRCDIILLVIPSSRPILPFFLVLPPSPPLISLQLSSLKIRTEITCILSKLKFPNVSNVPESTFTQRSQKRGEGR